MNFRHKKKKSVEVTLTPMIDVVFLLLIFFMVTTTFNKETQLDIHLPEANGQEQADFEQVINLTVDADGVYYINKHQVVNNKPDTLRRAILKASKQKNTVPFIIRADAKTPHQSVVTALDVAGKLGFKQIVFATKGLAD